MSEIVPLQAFGSSQEFQASQVDLPRVIVEGPDDLRFFEDLFSDYTEYVVFVPAERLVGGGGCTAVGPAVTKSWTQNIPAVGVVDRDTFLRSRDWNLLFEVDPAAFEAGARTEQLFVTSVWEVEGYLVQADLLGDWVATQRNPMPATAAERASALDRTLEECEALLNAAAFYASGHAAEASYPDLHFREIKHDQLGHRCSAELANTPAMRQTLAAELETLIAKVRATAPASGSARLEFLLQFVNSKRLLGRLEHRLGLRKDAKHGLVFLMSKAKARPAELERFLDEALERFAA